MQYMPAVPIVRAKEVRDAGAIVEIVVWRLTEPLRPCTHFYKYRLFFGANGVCHVRYDNELGKGDHRHLGGVEEPYDFVSLAQLLDDFQRDVETWR
jgi:hypothetical protein